MCVIFFFLNVMANKEKKQNKTEKEKEKINSNKKHKCTNQKEINAKKKNVRFFFSKSMFF